MSPEHPSLDARDESLQAVARGGPLDGQVLGLADADSYEVRLTDGTRWGYIATDERERLADGSTAVAYASTGRVASG